MTEPKRLLLKPDDHMPNSPLPVLIYRRAILPDKDGKAAGFEKLFHDNDWHGVWRNGIYDHHHFHSTSHEVLGIEVGRAQVQLGGASGELLDVEAGDVLILPAGTGHRRVTSSLSLSVIGGYPRGQERPDLMRERTADAEARIAMVTLPATDPVRGRDGPLVRIWAE
jgi:uncharacterized protein YjlB